MTSLTLTSGDVEAFAESAYQALGQWRHLYTEMLPKFPTVTPEALEAMQVAIAADPQRTGSAPGTDAAVYFAAQFDMAARNQDDDIVALTQGNAAALLSLFQRATECGDYISALSQLSNGVLVNQLHYAGSDARSNVATAGANALHARNAEAKAWVLSEWAARKSEFKNNKTTFGRRYAPKVKEKFPKARCSAETIKDDWLPKG